ncbi:hypothetical protein HPJ99_08085 [Anoxybacillus flavithermus]|nr:hypothetical protein CA592_12125 [Anoxybacillus flavithermus]MBE2906275.1 hypothetical protein [Anoxybacillus flavithermus]MBE2908615.1 hypothetical protein [Anoxybacillus flavithermus]MBE2911326.1 hypothetical protein [Anoxybacillus flavithermus]MBE2913890.1 hypothetical protein [Anoxybacillus flavithermus]
MSQIERGSQLRRPPIDLLESIAKIYGVEISYLFRMMNHVQKEGILTI